MLQVIPANYGFQTMGWWFLLPLDKGRTEVGLTQSLGISIRKATVLGQTCVSARNVWADTQVCPYSGNTAVILGVEKPLQTIPLHHRHIQIKPLVLW